MHAEPTLENTAGDSGNEAGHSETQYRAFFAELQRVQATKDAKAREYAVAQSSTTELAKELAEADATLRAKETRLRRVESEAAQARACVDAHREEETRICTELKELEAATASISLQVKRFTAQAARRNAREQKENERARGLRATIEFSAQRESAAGRRLCELKAALEQCVENETLALEAATTERRLEELRRRKARMEADIERNGEERGALRDAVTRARARIAERSNLLSLLQAARGSLAEGRRELQSEQAQVARLQAVASHMEAELFDASLSLRTRGAPAATLSPSPPRAHAQATRPRLPLARPAPPLSRGGGGGGGGKASLVDYW